MDIPRESSTGQNPTSALLQDMIKEKRAQTHRISKTHDSGGQSRRPETETRDVQSSPLSGSSSRNRPRMQPRRNSGMAVKAPPAPREMGLREMQEHISKINKQNFDLKLEIFHRRQRNELLESKVEKLEGLDAENEELRVANNDLMLQIQKRDADIDMREAAIEEAVAMICDLEARIEELKQQLLNSTQGKADQTTLPSQRVIVDSLSTPPQILKEAINGNSLRSQIPDDSVHSDAIPRIPSRSPLRQPSFLRNPKRSTVALRSLYSSANPSFISLKRPSSVFTDAEFDEEMERQMLNSPRLSILSESGFSSIYGHPRDQTASPAQSQSPSAANDQASHSPAWRAAHHEARIKDWVEESNRHERPETPVRKSLHPTASGHISSISQVLEEFPSDPSQQPARSPSSPRSASSNAQQRSEKVFLDRRSPTKSLRQSARAHHKLSLGSGPVFCSNHLPPTPDTMSTATTGGNSSMQSIIIEKSLADGSAAPPNGYAALVQHHPSPPSSNEVAVTDEIVIHNDMAPETSDDEMESIKVERSDIGSQGNDIGYAESPLHMGASMKATQFFGSDMPARPALTTYRSDIMFNGEGFSPKRPSRGSSYPSPADSGQHASKHVSPSRSSKRSSGVPSERTVTSPRLSSPSHPRSSSVLQPTTQDVDVQIKLNEKSHRASSSLRFRLPRVSSTANAPQSQSIGSRIFRRTNSQVSNSPDTKGSSPVQTKPSFRPHLPRPSSLYATRPGTSDGTHADEMINKNMEREKGVRRRSTVVDNSVVCLVKEDIRSSLRRASESRHESKGLDEGRFRGIGRTASAKIRDGLGLKR